MDHPSNEMLLSLSLGRISEAELMDVSVHLGECADCRGRIDTLAAEDPLLARLRQGAGDSLDALATPEQRRAAVRVLRGQDTLRVRETFGPPTATALTRVGEYEIIREVGRGGMGVVYQARHRALNRTAALKMILERDLATPAQEVRFRLEAELAARVRHPNIVHVYEVGSHEGRPFLAMEWVDGGSLEDRLNSKPWPPEQAAALVETLARAIDVAHGEGVIHRDLKPANILLVSRDPEGSERLFESRLNTPKITDFGLARPIESGQTMTQSGMLVGTPGYMAPEQASGKRAQVGPATDIYALGVVLYQLLTGQLPFQGKSTLELLMAITSEEPPRPRRLQPRLPRDLEAITLHCLEKEPGQRYATALALAEDLRCFQEGQPVAARPVGSIARVVRAARRRPLVTSLLILLAFSLFGGLAGVSWKWLEANSFARQAEAGKEAALYQAYRACVAAAGAALENHDPADAARHLRAAPEELRGWEWRHLNSRLDASAAMISLSDKGGVLIPGASRFLLGVWTPTGLDVDDLDGGVARTLAIRPENPLAAVQTRHGLRVAVYVKGETIKVLDDAGKVLCRIAGTERFPLNDWALSPNAARLACTGVNDNTDISLFDAVSGKPTASCKGHGGTVWALAFSPDESRLASGGEDRTVRLWDAATGAPLAVCQGHTSKIVSAAFSPDGARLVTASSDGTVRQWDTMTGAEAEPPYDRHGSEVYTVAYSPDGQWIVSAGADRTVRVWRSKGREDLAVLVGHTGRINQVEFAPDGRRVVSVSCSSTWVNFGDNTARIWNVDPLATLPALRGHKRSITGVVYSANGRWLASASRDGTVRLWDAATGEPCATLNHPSVVWGLAFGPDGTWLAASCPHDGQVRIWDVATGRVRKEFQFQGMSGDGLIVSPDGRNLTLTRLNPEKRKKEVIVCDSASGKLLRSTDGMALAYSLDGRWLAALAGDDKTVLLLDAQTLATAASFSGHTSGVSKAAFSRDGAWLATCGKDRTVRLWPIGGGEAYVLKGHTDEVYAVAFHPDGKRLASGCQDGSIWLWDLERRVDVVRLPGHKSFVWSLAFSPTGETLASGSGDTTVRLWDTFPLKSRYPAQQMSAARRETDRLLAQFWRTAENRQSRGCTGLESNHGIRRRQRLVANLPCLDGEDGLAGPTLRKYLLAQAAHKPLAIRAEADGRDISIHGDSLPDRSRDQIFDQ